MRRTVIYILFVVAASCGWASADQRTDAAVRTCRRIIEAAQLDDGAIRMTPNGPAVRVIPYFSNLAAIALLTDPADAPRVRNWLAWYAAHQEPDGTIYDYEGTVDHYARGKDRDSTDSYAATYLMALRRYEGATHDPSAKDLSASAAKALDAIALTQDPADGLTWAKPTYRVKYLMDNLEVWSGLTEGSRFFDAIGDRPSADRARAMADRCRRGLQAFWRPDAGCYAIAKFENGKFQASLKDWYPDGMANLMAASIIRPVPAVLWPNVKRAFAKEPKLTPDWWLRAAVRVGTTDEVAAYQAQTTAAVERTSATADLEAAAWSALGLFWEQAGFPPLNLEPAATGK